MKHITASFLFFFIISVIISCNTENTQEDATLSDGNIVTITPDNKNDSIRYPFSLDNYIDSIRYVKLELSDESLIGDITAIEAYKNHIYIMDIQTSSLFIYTIDGKFVSKIHTVGNGPREYVQLDYFSIDRNYDQLILTDLMGYWVLRYDLKGNFIKRTKIPFWIDGIYPIDNKGYALFANKRNNKQYFKQEFSLYLVDSLMKIKKQYFPYNSQNYNRLKVLLPGNGGFYTINNKSHYYNLYTDTVYQIDTDGLRKKYVFDLGDFKFNTNLEKKNNELFRDYFNKKNYAGISIVSESDEFILFYTCFLNHPMGCYNIYCKKTNNIITSWTFYLDHNPFSIFIPSTYDDFFIDIIGNNSFHNYKIESKKINSRQMQIKNIQENYTEEDNPIIVFYKFKQF